MSLNEANSNFTVDASNTPPSNNYMMVGENVYGYSYSGTNIAANSFGDIDTYGVHLDIGTKYIIQASGSNIFGTPVTKANFALLDRNGKVLSLSYDYITTSKLSFTAGDSFFIYKNISLNSFIFINFNKDLNYYLIVIFLCILVIKLYSFLHFVTIKKILTKNYIIYKDWLFIFLISNFLSAVPFLGIFYRAYSLKKLNLSYINFATYVFTIKFLFLILTFLFITFELYFFF